ncbi:MAG: acetylxylan esterase [Verrucomicrobia bacterium]|nr:acetylxylan esterase [Verrucomicrobiota bacterium]
MAAAPRALPEGIVPNDARLQPPKDLDGYFPFTPAKTPDEWAKRAERVRRQILVSQGLWPLPTKTPLNPVIHGKIERDNYTVEKVYFESLPGFFVTGNLYRPKGKTGKLPAVLAPHGHWADGRFHDAGAAGVLKEIVQGAERFEEGGRSPLQARAVQLARMGCVVFHYDMIGYADSVQISFDLAHRFGKQRPEMNTTENWGLFSPQAEAHLQSVMGLQTWNSIRALDFLLGLPDVDADRIACSGASGGGTQTFILSAIDPRVKLAFPAVMVSTAMQGGCTCENACDLRVGTGNVEFAALFAPKPLGLTAADDWTKEMAVKGFPELKQHYAMLGAPDNVMLKPLVHFGHNYNYVSRAAFYSWVNKHFQLDRSEPIVEQDYVRLTRDEMSVWDDAHPKPAGGPEFERKLLRWLTDDAEKQLNEAAKSADEFRKIFGGAIDVVIGRNFSEVGTVEWDMKEKTDRGGYLEMVGLVRNTTHAEEVPAVFLHPKQWNNQTVIWLDAQGKAGLFAAGGGSRPKPEIEKLLVSGVTIVGVDLLFQGEFLADGKPITQTRRVKNTREAAPYTFGYNPTLFAQRVHDVLTLVKYITGNERKTQALEIVGLGGAGPWAAAAAAQCRGEVHRAVIDTGGFRFGRVLDLHDVDFLPGGAKYGDLPGLLALFAPARLWLAGEGAEAPALAKEIYQKAGAAKQLEVFNGDAQRARVAALEWLLARPAN